MNPFWKSLFDHLNGCGRNATLFIVALGALFGLLLGVAMLLESQHREYFLNALPWIGGIFAVWICLAIRRARTRRRERLQCSPLSDDELFKARSKLARNRNPR